MLDVVAENRIKFRVSDVDFELDIIDALNGLHTSSGNDYISSFCRKEINILTGKKRPQVNLQRLRKV